MSGMSMRRNIVVQPTPLICALSSSSGLIRITAGDAKRMPSGRYFVAYAIMRITTVT